MASSPERPFVRTRSGRALSLSNPKASEVHVDDIAGGLAKLCRFAGQTVAHYSVAQHSVLVAQITTRAAENDQFWDYRKSRVIGLHALLHDSPEAYLGDVTWPVKHMIRGVERRNGSMVDSLLLIDTAIHKAIYEYFGLEWPIPLAFTALIKNADYVALATECRDVLTPGPDLTMNLRIPLPEPESKKIEPLRWELAERQFMDAIAALTTARDAPEPAYVGAGRLALADL